MKMLALFTVKPFLSQVPGVSEVRIIRRKNKGILDPLECFQNGHARHYAGYRNDCTCIRQIL